MKAAFLILDAQNDFFTGENPNRGAFLQTVPVVNAAASAFRARGWPVIFVQHTSARKPEGSFDWTLYAGFDYRPEDLFLNKHAPDAFAGTDLHARLQEMQVDTVLIAGFLAEQCVCATCTHATTLGYTAVLLREGIAGLDEDARVTALSQCRAVGLVEATQGELAA